MSKQYLQTLTIPDAHPTDIFSLAVTPSHLLTASGSTSIKIYSTKGQAIHADTAEDENPYPLVQTLEKVHKLGCHHVSASLDGRVAASVGFGGELKVWECAEDGEWKEKGLISVGAIFSGNHILFGEEGHADTVPNRREERRRTLGFRSEREWPIPCMHHLRWSHQRIRHQHDR